MVAIQHAKIPAAGRVWLIMGEDTGLYGATKRYLESRAQIVLCNAGLTGLHDQLADIVMCYETIDMLIVNDLKQDLHLSLLFEKIYTVSSCMRRDGSSQIIFVRSGNVGFKQLKHTKGYQELKQRMKEQTIQVHCFESC
jgi:hypothetical protein